MKNKFPLFLWITLSLSILINTIAYSQTEEEEDCKLIFDFGTDEQNYCDSSLVKMGFFHYGLVDGIRVQPSKEIYYNPEGYEDDLIKFKTKFGRIKIKRKGDKSYKTYNLSKLFLHGEKFEPLNNILVFNGYLIKKEGKVFYLLFLKPETTNSSTNWFRPILIDLNHNNIEVIPLPSYQESNSLQCLRFSENNNSLFYISFDMLSDIDQPYRSVYLYKYNYLSFKKISNFVIELKPSELIYYPLRLINYSKSKITPIRYAK
jgi:hypothetical protein